MPLTELEMEQQGSSGIWKEYREWAVAGNARIFSIGIVVTERKGLCSNRDIACKFDAAQSETIVFYFPLYSNGLCNDRRIVRCHTVSFINRLIAWCGDKSKYKKYGKNHQNDFNLCRYMEFVLHKPLYCAKRRFSENTESSRTKI